MWSENYDGPQIMVAHNYVALWFSQASTEGPTSCSAKMNIRTLPYVVSSSCMIYIILPCSAVKTTKKDQGN